MSKKRRYTSDKKAIIKQLASPEATDGDQIIAHLQGLAELPERLKPKLERLEVCADYIRQHGGRRKVIPMLVKEFGISRMQAYRDYDDSLDVFGATTKLSRPFFTEDLIGMIKRTYAVCMKKQDYKTAAALVKTYKDTIKELMGDEEGIPFDKIQPPQINIAFMPSSLEVKIDEAEMLKELKKIGIPEDSMPIIDIQPEDTEDDSRD